MECDFHPPHIKDLKSTLARAPCNLEAAKNVLQKTHSRQSSEELKDDSRSTRKPALLSYEEFGGLSGINPQVSTRRKKMDSY
jgi:hypothetical protein